MSITNNDDIVKIFNKNNITQNDYKDIYNLYKKHKIPIIDNFLDNKKIVFLNNNLNLLFNDNYLQKLKKDDFKKYKEFKKARKIKSILKYINVSNDTKDKINDIFKEIDNNITNVVKKIFNSEITKIDKTFRFTLTENENLHFDTFQPPKKDENIIRVFINLDDIHRVWNNSYNIYQYIDKYKKEIICEMNLKNIHLTYDGEKTGINRFIVNEVMKSSQIDDINYYYKNGFPKIINKFSPGSIWICDSIVNSHQIIYGKKCISYKFYIKNNDKNSFYKKIISYISNINMQKQLEQLIPKNIKYNTYININDYWCKEEINNIINNYPSNQLFEGFDKEHNIENTENRYNIRMKDILCKKNSFHKSICNFFTIHSKKEYFHHLIDIFKLDQTLKKKTFGIYGIDKDVEIFAKHSLCVNYPNDKSVRGIHLDKQNSIVFGLLYLKKDNDKSTGANLDIFNFKNDTIKNNYIQECNNDIKDFNKIMLDKLEHKDLIKVDKIQYKKNNLVLLKNGWNTIHSVTPRKDAIENRIFINIVFMYNTNHKNFNSSIYSH
jgi:hypothetical protein